MRIVWTLGGDLSRHSLTSAFRAGECYDVKTYNGTRGCLVFRCVTDAGSLKFYDQFAIDGFGAEIELAPTDIIRVWQ